ncbi:MAG: DUF2339 domain-containing protein [Gemmatimonadales bacterium]
MSDSDRLDRLETRIATLERLMRQLAAELPPAESPAPPIAASSLAAARPVSPEIAAPSAARPFSSGAPASASPAAPRLDGEQWVGQRGLLAVGVTALVLALAYLLKLSFDRGWVSPVLRCLGGASCGVIVGALGWRLERRGLRTYGAGLLGTGAGMIYLAVWAAGRLYAFLPPANAIAALALVSLGLAALAYAVDVEALGATAALGAFLAPVVIGPPASDLDLLLLYLGCMGLALGGVAALKRWRIASVIIALAYFGLGAWGAKDAHPLAALLFAALGGAGGIWLGLRERWWETRFLAFSGAWGCLAAASSTLGPSGLLLFGGVVLAVPVWRHAFAEGVVPFHGTVGSLPPIGEALYFYLTPWLLGWALNRTALVALETHRGLAAGVIALAYLGVAFARGREPFALVAAGAAATGILMEWSGLDLVWALGAVALIWGLTGRWTSRRDWEWYGGFTLLGAVIQLVAAAGDRHPADPAFFDVWALTLWSIALMAAVWANGEVAGRPAAAPAIFPRQVFWPVAGGTLFFGVTGELLRLFRQSALVPASRELAGGLAVSAWWIVFAGALIGFGFRRGLKPVRVAGLWVSGLAVAKVLLVDLRSLDALYRVASVLILGVVSLGTAYLYHRRVRVSS